MVISFQNYDGLSALDMNQAIQPTLGTGIESGCDFALPNSSSPIEVSVETGNGYINGTAIQVTAGSPNLSNGDNEHPRKDVICADSNGSLVALEGTPRQAETGAIDGTDRKTYQPEPPDLSSQTTIGDLAPIVEVWIPAGATTTEDMNESGVAYLRDRRLPQSIV